MKASNVTRIQLNVPKAVVAEINALVSPCGELTHPALYANGKTLFTWVFDERALGRRIVSIAAESDNYRELVMSFHETATFRSELMRLSLDFNPSVLAEIDELTVRCGDISYMSLFSNFLTVLLWAIKERIDGRRIVSIGVDSDNHRELVMPFLEAVATANK
jgi:hypothetical protein